MVACRIRDRSACPAMNALFYSANSSKLFAVDSRSLYDIPSQQGNQASALYAKVDYNFVYEDDSDA